MTIDEYRRLRVKKGRVVYAHCGNCMDSKPAEVPPDLWARLEGVMDLTTGVMTVGCARCEMPIVSAMLPPDLVKDIKSQGCLGCNTKGGDNGGH